MSDLGEIRLTGDTVEIVFRRRYAKPVEKIWAALTVPERLADWFTDVEIEALRVGAKVRLDFKEVNVQAEGVIVQYDPPRTIAWTWSSAGGGESVVRFDLEPDGDGCRLTLTESGLKADHGAGNAAGWHAHLEALEDAAEGVRTAWATLLEREAAVNALYKGRAPA
jgi:uncharacterized protein YndB with AHSA1/START domain